MSSELKCSLLGVIKLRPAALFLPACRMLFQSSQMQWLKIIRNKFKNFSCQTTKSLPNDFIFSLSDYEFSLCIMACFHYDRGMEYSLFVLLIFFASLSARLDFKRRKIIKKERMLHSMLVVETNLFTTSNCGKAGRLSFVLKQIAKFITITSSNKNIKKCPVLKPI